VNGFSKFAGEVLRNARRDSGLTLHAVARRSRGRFKPSSLGGYERGERGISLERFCDLARLYQRPADGLLGEMLALLKPKSRQEIVIDLNRLSSISEGEAVLVAEFVHNIRTRRGDYLSEVITLRSADLEELSLSSRQRPETLLAKLRPAVRAS
jgi:transcriptional regulator with XRE-family HTH domain